MSDVAPTESGLASGVVNTSFMMGGALGLAILASLAAAVTGRLLVAGSSPLAALNGGYHVAFLVAALFAACASALGAALIRAPVAATPGNVASASYSNEIKDTMNTSTREETRQCNTK